MGIVIGPASWSDDTDTTVYGGTVVDNTLEGGHFGYGIVVSSAKGFKVVKNTIKEDTAFNGVPGPRCPKAPENAEPMALLINRGSSDGTFQRDFVNGEVQHSESDAYFSQVYTDKQSFASTRHRSKADLTSHGVCGTRRKRLQLDKPKTRNPKP